MSPLPILHSVMLCEHVGFLGDDGVCPEHGGDVCLAVYVRQTGRRQPEALPLQACAECGFYLIHYRHCSQYAEPADDDGHNGEWTPPEDARDALLHFEQWVEPWANCFDCQADPAYEKSLFSIRHRGGCMVRWLHQKLLADAQAEELAIAGAVA